METPTKNPLRPDATGSAANYTFEPDAEMQAIISKREAGAKLTPSEGGKLGQWLKRAGKTVGAAAAGIKHAISPASDSVVASSVVPPVAPDDGFPVVPPDADLVRGTVKSILESCNDIAARKLSASARLRGADGETLRRFAGAKVFGENRATMIVNTSPQAFEAMGITNGKAFALSVFWGNIGLGACDFWLAIDELKAMDKKVAEQRRTESPPPAPPAPVAPSAVMPQTPGQPTHLRIPQAEPPPPYVEKKNG